MVSIDARALTDGELEFVELLGERRGGEDEFPDIAGGTEQRHRGTVHTRQSNGCLGDMPDAGEREHRIGLCTLVIGAGTLGGYIHERTSSTGALCADIDCPMYDTRCGRPRGAISSCCARFPSGAASTAQRPTRAARTGSSSRCRRRVPRSGWAPRRCAFRA